MRINHNIAALNTYRQLNSASNAQSKSMEKLSSGLRINKAGDDAAGLAISEKMRGQIRGLDMASRNAQDGISMIQTAEGALNETHDILQRMKELATQAANGTNTDSDRGEIQKEMNQLTSEINRIGNTTEFNTKKLLNGGGGDPTSSTKVSGNGLTVPTSLTGGEGATEQLASTEITFAAANAATDYDGKSFSLSIGDKTFTVNTTATDIDSGGTDQGKGATASTSGNTITLATTYDSDTDGSSTYGGVVAEDVASALKTEIENIISADDSLKGKYTVSTNSAGKLTIAATALSMDENGKLQGAGTSGVVSFDEGTLTADEFTSGASKNVGAIGKNATAEIDFSNAKAEDLVGTGIVVSNKKVDFYDSAKGSYEGNADFAIDLNGARTSEQIVDKIVDALSGDTSDTVAAATTSMTYGADHSAIDNAFLTKDGSKLVITSQTAGAAGNDIKAGNNAAVTVTNTYDSTKLEGESVVSAKGLSDGEHKVTISNVAASVGNKVTSSNGSEAATITVANTADSGTYKVDLSTAATAQLQKYNADTDSWDNVGDTFDATATGATTIGDITIDVTSAFANNDSLSFNVDGNHYEASLTEADGTAGDAVRVASGETNVKLSAQDGIGEAVINIGTINDSVGVDQSASWSFETTATGKETTEVVGGTFTEKLQIGANNGQSFQVDFKDMRSQALNISGTTAGATAGGVDGAKFTAVKDVTNGTNNDGTEYALDVSTHESATAAIEVLDNAINAVSAERSKMGAYQNRLEHTINNLGTSSENLTAAESRIRDVDMAKEMMNQTKNSILSQAAQAMLAQANQQPQGVLQLLR